MSKNYKGMYTIIDKTNLDMGMLIEVSRLFVNYYKRDLSEIIEESITNNYFYEQYDYPPRVGLIISIDEKRRKVEYIIAYQNIGCYESTSQLISNNVISSQPYVTPEEFRHEIDRLFNLGYK